MLDPEALPQELLEFDTWCDSDAQLSDFRDTLRRQGRLPTLREYRAARKCVDQAEARRQHAELVERARDAAGKFRNVPTPSVDESLPATRNRKVALE